MTGHHERPGSHPLAEYDPEAERPTFREQMDRIEVGENGGGFGVPITWASVKELVYVVTIALALAGAYYGLRSEIQDVRGEVRDGHHDVEALAARVVVIEHGRNENLPRLEEQIRNNAIQDTRIQNLTDSLGRVVSTVGDLARIVTNQAELIHETHEREAVLEERLGHVGPHDR